MVACVQQIEVLLLGIFWNFFSPNIFDLQLVEYVYAESWMWKNLNLYFSLDAQYLVVPGPLSVPQTNARAAHPL